MIPWKILKKNTAHALQDEVCKVAPGLSRFHIFVVAIVCSGVGVLLMNVPGLEVALRIYGGVMFVAGLLSSIVTFEPEAWRLGLAAHAGRSRHKRSEERGDR